MIRTLCRENRPDGKVGHDAYAVIRETIRSLDKVAVARVVLTNREHIIALEARDKGLMGMLLRYPYEVRDASEYFDEIQDRRAKEPALRAGQVRGSLRERPDRAFEEKQKGLPIVAAKNNVVNLMDALRASLKSSGKAPAAKPAKAPAKKAAKKRKAG